MRSIFLFLAMGFGFAVTGDAFAAVEITSETVQAATGRAMPSTIYLAPDALKMDMERVAIIYRQDTGTVTNVMKDKQQYMSLDPAKMAQMNAMMATMQARMQQQMASMPEAQRKAMEANGGGMPGMSGPQQAAVFEKTGQTKTIGSWTCQVFRKIMNGGLTIDSCFAPLSAIGLTHDDLAALQAMSVKMKKLMPSMANAGGNMDFAAQTQQIGFEGFPVESVIQGNGQIRSTSTVKSIQHAPLPAGVFDIPAGYTPMEMPNFPQ